jgi:hypothetical protein
MTEIIVPANIRVFRSEAAEEMGTRDPLDTDKVRFLDGSLVPVEVYRDLAKAADKRGTDVGRYLVDAAFKQALYDLTGADYD